MNLKPPKDAREVHQTQPFEPLKRIANELYWGNPEGVPAGHISQWRGVVVIGCVLAKKPGAFGELFLKTGGAWTVDDKEPEVSRALAEQLRDAADRLEREAGS